MHFSVLFFFFLLAGSGLVSPLRITRIEERGFLSQLNRFYLYLQFDGAIDSLTADYSVDLYLDNRTCLDELKVFTLEKTMALGCQYTESHITPTIKIRFLN